MEGRILLLPMGGPSIRKTVEAAGEGPVARAAPAHPCHGAGGEGVSYFEVLASRSSVRRALFPLELIPDRVHPREPRGPRDRARLAQPSLDRRESTLELPVRARSASAGSTFSTRERLTTVNSMSPTSSSTFDSGRLRQPPPAAPLSPRSLSQTGATSGQSKPTFAAFRWIASARSSGGREPGTPSSAESGPAAPFSPALIASHWTRTSADRLCRRIAEHVGVAPDELCADALQDIRDGEGALLLLHHRNQGHEQVQVAKLLAQVRVVAGIDGDTHSQASSTRPRAACAGSGRRPRGSPRGRAAGARCRGADRRGRGGRFHGGE